MRIVLSIIVFGVTVGLAWAQPAPEPPRVVRAAIGFAPLVWPDGAIEHFYAEGEHGNQTLVRIRSRDDGNTWSPAEPVMPLPTWGTWAGRGGQPMIDREGNLHLLLLDLAPKYQEMWHTKKPARREWTQLQKIGPSLPQNPPIELKTGRIVFPVGYQFRDAAWSDPKPIRRITSYHSDDAGDHWIRSSSVFSISSFETRHGPTRGAHEPVMVELKDGRVWMLIRTQMGWLYESHSDDGSAWSQPQPSRFRSADGPGSIVRLSSGELVLIWHNSEDPSPVDGQWLYTSRDTLHGAISSDDGETWRGFREVYKDPFRNEDPPPKGDFGTGYPSAAVTPTGAIILVAGQNAGRCKLIRIDPTWLLATQHHDDFSSGLEGWSVFKGYGAAQGFRRKRVAGAECIPHPSNSQARVLHVRRADEKSGDGATWNFPAGQVGRATLRIQLQKDFAGGLINLADYFIFPNDTDCSKVVFSLPLASDGRIGKGGLVPGRWHTIELEWAVEQKRASSGWPGTCSVRLDGIEVETLKQLNRARSGLSYLRLHSTAPLPGGSGFLIERVAMKILR